MSVNDYDSVEAKIPLINTLQLNGDETFLRSNSVMQENSIAQTNLMRIISNLEEAYMFSCIAGIVEPQNFKENDSLNVGKKLWSQLLYYTLILSVISAIMVSVFICVEVDNSIFLWENVGFALGQLYQVMTILYAINRFLRKELQRERWMHISFYTSAITYSVKICKPILIALNTVYFTALICRWATPSQTHYGNNSTFYQTIVNLNMLAFVASNFYLVALLFLIIIELRVSLQMVQTLTNEVESHTLTHTAYCEARTTMKQNEATLPINMLVILSIVNTIFGIASSFNTLILNFSSFYHDVPPSYFIYYFLIVLGTFGRELIFLLVLLFEIVKVNDEAERMLNKVVETVWDDETPGKQILLFMVMKQQPVGASIFYKKPQTYHIIIQIASSIVVTMFAFLRIYLFQKH